MANSRTLLVYVLALVVCGSFSSSFWVSANTVPLLKEPVAPGASSSQHQKHQQQHRVQQPQPLPVAQHQQIQETSRTSPSSPSPSSTAPLAPAPVEPQNLSQNPTNNNNNAPATYSIKNAWGLSAGNSNSGPYTAGYGYISGRTLQQPVNTPKSDYYLSERPSRQTTPSAFDGFSAALQSLGTSGWNLKSILFGGAVTYAVTNFGLPESVTSLIPIGAAYFRSGAPSKEAKIKKEKEPIVPLKEESKPKESETVKEVPIKKEVEAVKEMPQTKEVEVVVPVKDAQDAPIKNEAPAPTNRRRKRDVSPQPDTDLTELAAMVLSAVQSGECMQRSICILGSQIGASNKGRAAFTLVDKLVPESVQGNQYFVTLKKALRGGESFCDRFRCRLN